MDGRSHSRNRIPALASLFLTATPLFAWPLGEPTVNNDRYYPPPSVYGYNLFDRAPTYYGGGNYREYYSFGRGFGFADFPGDIRMPVNPIVRNRHKAPCPLPPIDYVPTSHLFPEAKFDVYVPCDAEVWLEGQKTQQSGEMRTFISPPLEPGGELTQRESVTRANIVRYIRARETYDPRGLRDNFDLASLFSAGSAAKDLQAEFAASNPNNPMKKFGAETTISVFVKSVIFLNERTAAVRFQTTLKSEREAVSTDWVANVRFRYTSEPMRNDWRFDNPLGFQVVEYRRDQEAVGAKPEEAP